MTAIALSFFVTGLVLGVYAMLYGTERAIAPAAPPHERHSEHNPAAEPSPLFNVASVAAFAVGFGLAGYLLTQHTPLPWGARLALALVAGSATFALQSLLIARWAIPGARIDTVDQRYLLQGTLARVTHEAPAGSIGTLVYALDGREYTLPVRSLDESALAVGSDVVIDRVEDGVAIVEAWELVEQRL